MESTFFGKFKLSKQKKKEITPKKLNGKLIINTGNNISKPNNDSMRPSSIVSDKNVIKKKVREKNGCFCCRKRRIKCTGSKPTCNNCLRASYLCVWPDGDESLPHKNNFQIVKINKKTKVTFRNDTQNIIQNTNKNDIKNDTKSNTKDDTKNVIKNESSSSLNFTSNTNTDLQEKKDIILSYYSNLNEQQENEFINIDSANNSLIKTKKHKQSEIIEDNLFRKFLIEINSSVISQVLPSLRSLPWMSSKESLLYDAFVNGFMTDVSPQLTHFKLQPASAFIPSLVEHSMVQSLFCATGAAFLYSASKNDEMKYLSRNKFIDSVNKFNQFISTNDIKKNSGWILIYLLIIFLKTKFIYEGQKDETLQMISITEVMKIWINKKAMENSSNNRITELNNDHDLANISNNDLDDYYFELKLSNNDIYSTTNSNNINENYTTTIFDDFVKKFKHESSNNVPLIQENSITMIADPTSVENEIFMALTQNNDDDNDSVIVADSSNNNNNNVRNSVNVQLLPHERTMVESFVFNYSNLIFVCDRSLISQMTSPFIVFDMLRPYLSVPIYKCAVPWMNHPVVGAALPNFEMQAKVSWLGLFYPLSEEQKKIVSKLRNTANYYTRPILPIDVRKNEPENVQKKLLESCYAAEFVAKAVFIYSTKLLYPDMDYSCNLIQTNVQQAFDNLINISIHSQIHMILGFAFAIIGSVSIEEKHRRYLTWKLSKLSEVFSVSTFGSMIKFYEKAWRKTKDGDEVGWDVLIDPEAIKGLII